MQARQVCSDQTCVGPRPCNDYDHVIKWKESKLIAPVSKYYPTQIRESIEIHKHQTMPQEEKPRHDKWTSLF